MGITKQILAVAALTVVLICGLYAKDQRPRTDHDPNLLAQQMEPSDARRSAPPSQVTVAGHGNLEQRVAVLEHRLSQGLQRDAGLEQLARELAELRGEVTQLSAGTVVAASPRGVRDYTEAERDAIARQSYLDDERDFQSRLDGTNRLNEIIGGLAHRLSAAEAGTAAPSLRGLLDAMTCRETVCRIRIPGSQDIDAALELLTLETGDVFSYANVHVDPSGDTVVFLGSG